LTISAVGDEDFSIERWPVKYDHTREALKAMKETHRVNCPPIWDAELNLVRPNLLESTLRGAIVKVMFKLKHITIAVEGESRRWYRFMSELTDVVILENA
jgi:hypothetical protein